LFFAGSSGLNDIRMFPGKTFKFELKNDSSKVKTMIINSAIRKVKGGNSGYCILKYPDLQYRVYIYSETFIETMKWEDIFKW
jgi:hypothetical protein